MPSCTDVSRSLAADDYPGMGRYVWRVTDGTLEWSPGLVKIYGREAAPASEAEFMACLHPKDRIRVEGETEAFLTSHANSYSHNFRIIRPNGEVRYLIDRARIERDAEGRVTEIHGLNIDLTDFPHLTHSTMDAEFESAEKASVPHTYSAQDQLENGQRTSGPVLADIDYRAGTVALSAEAARLYGLGYNAMTVPRETLHATFHPADRDALHDEIARSLDPKAGGGLVTEHRILMPTGDVRWVQMQGRIDFRLVDGQRQPDRGIMAAVDITARVQAEIGVKASARRLALAQAVTGIGVWDADLLSGRSVWTNEMYELLQIDPATPSTPEVFFERVHPEDAARVRRQFEAAIEERSWFESEFRIIRPDGAIRHVSGQGRVTAEENGRPARVTGVNFDITERKNTELQIAQSEARYRTLFTSINAGFCVIEVCLDGPDGKTDYRVVEANPAFYDRTGFPKAILGHWLREAAPDLEEHWYDIYGGVARTGEPARFEEHSEALGFWFDVYAFRIDAPEAGRVAILFHDISERKQHEEHVGLLLKEVNHRAKNMLALIEVIAKRTAANGTEGFIERFSDRLRALSANQDVLVTSDWKEVNIKDLLRAQLAHFSDLFETRVHFDGVPLTVIPVAAERIGMALHELATNAGKYGALSQANGQVCIDWQIENREDGQEFILQWKESGGPQVEPPESNGFGSLVSGTLLEVRAGWVSRGRLPHLRVDLALDLPA